MGISDQGHPTSGLREPQIGTANLYFQQAPRAWVSVGDLDPAPRSAFGGGSNALVSKKRSIDLGFEGVGEVRREEAETRFARDSRAWRKILALASLAVLTLGCRSEPSATTVVEFWAMGREGEVVQRMVPEFERAHPGIRVRVQQIPWSAAHEKLLTAYVGERDARRLPGRQHVDPRVRRAGRDRAARRADATLDRGRGRDDYFPGILDTNVDRRRDLRAAPGTSTRACSSIARDLLAAGGLSRGRRATGRPGSTRWRGSRSGRLPGDFAILLPMNEWQPPVILALQRGATLLRDGDRYGDFREPRVPRGVRLLPRSLPPRAGAAASAGAGREPLPGLRARRLRLLRHRALEHRRVPRPPAARSRDHGRRRRGRRRTAALSRRVARRRREPGAVPRLAPQGCGVAAGRVPHRAGAADRALPPDRRSAVAQERVDRGRDRRATTATRRRSGCSSSTCARRRRSPSGSASPTRSRSYAEAAIRGAAERSTRRSRRSTATSTRSSRSGAGCCARERRAS